MTWLEVAGYIRKHYKIALDSEERLGLVWTIGEAPRIEEQRQVVQHIRANGRANVCVSADIVDEAKLSPLDAVRHNATLGVGAIALVGTTYVLRAMLPLTDLTASSLDHALELVAHEAARMRHHIKGSVHAIPYED